MNNIVSFPSGGFRTGGDGPEEPMLEARVARLEDDMKDVKHSLRSIDISLAKMDGRISGIEGRLTGIDARFAALPTTWTMLTIIFATWGIGSGILIFVLNVLKR